MSKPLRSGHYERFGEHNHFVPSALPPAPPLNVDRELMGLYGEAMQSIGRLAEVQKRIPSTKQFLDIYIAKEAIYSSQIENINTTLTQVLEYNSRNSEDTDIQEVWNYINALQYGIELMREKNIPVSSRLIRECHRVLLSGVRGESKMPGQFRKVPVFVGQLVPPPAHYIENLIGDLEKFANEQHEILPLIRTGLSHVQFETIHPFLDGNGRIGRLLIVLMMMDLQLIEEPVVYPSFYFMKYRSEYYDRVDTVRTRGDYEGWVKYFLRAIRISTEDVVKRVVEIDDLLRECNHKIDLNLSRVHKNATLLLNQICHTPVLSTNDVAELIGATYMTAQKLVTSFVELQILQPGNDRKRNKSFAFRRYLDILEKEFLG